MSQPDIDICSDCGEHAEFEESEDGGCVSNCCGAGAYDSDPDGHGEVKMLNLKIQIKEAEARAYKLKTKKAQTKAWNKIKELSRELWLLLCEERNKYAEHSVKGTVIVDNSHCMSEYIMVKTAEYGILHVSPSNDILSKSWYPSMCCVEYAEGQQVIVECDIDFDRNGADRLCVYPKRVHGGVLNESKYAELCQRDDLAFFKYPDGRMSGLFK